MAHERRIRSEELNMAQEMEVEVDGYEVEVVWKYCIGLKNNELSKIIRRVWESASDWRQKYVKTSHRGSSKRR